MSELENKSEPRLLLYTAYIPVRWGDMDAFGHVNNCVYFTYFEQARILWLEQHSFPVRNIKTGPILATADCKFIKPIFHPAELIVKLYAGPGRRSSFTLYYEILDQRNDKILYAEGSTVIVWVDYELGKSIELPDEMRKHLPQFSGEIK